MFDMLIGAGVFAACFFALDQVIPKGLWPITLVLAGCAAFAIIWVQWAIKDRAIDRHVEKITGMPAKKAWAKYEREKDL